MNRILISLLSGVFIFSSAFSGERILKAPHKQALQKSRLVESDNRIEARGPSYWNKPYRHSNRNGVVNTLVDSSSNGYGMVVSQTKPIDVNEDGLAVMSYRQYAGAETTHGQLGAATSEDFEEWEAYFNINANGSPPWGGGAGVGNGGDDTAQARYPSALAGEEYPYAVWNEYTGASAGGAGYGGRLYWSFDEFGWGEGSWLIPQDVDLAWTDERDHWGASADIFLDADGNETVAVTADDWTRANNYYFRSLVVDEGTIVMGDEEIVFDAACFEGDSDDGSYNTATTLNINDDGFGVMGIIGLFAGGIDGTSEISNYHQPIFKITEDYGMTWHGPDANDPCSFYILGDALYLDMISTFPESYVDCAGVEDFIVDFWSYYDFDFKVDSSGNIHILMSVVPAGAEFVYFMEGAGWYHFTIDSSYLDNPGQINSPEGWNYTYVANMTDTWVFSANDGESNLWESQATLSFSKDDPDVVWIALTKYNEYACGELFDDFGNDDPCDDVYEYPLASADLFVYKSTDGGSTWWNPINVTNSVNDPDSYPSAWGGQCPDGLIVCGPEEMYPHAPQWSTSDEMYVMYQMPNWGFNEIGDLMGADHMNRVYAAKVEVTSDEEDEQISCDESDSAPQCNAGDTNDDGAIDLFDILAVVYHVVGQAELNEVGLCAADMQGDGNIDLFDIVLMVNIIIGDARIGSDATSVRFIESKNGVLLDFEGHVGAVEITLAHDTEFDLELISNISKEGISAVETDGQNTKIIVVYPASGKLFETENQFTIEKVLVVSGDGANEISSQIVDSYVLAKSYPNPFNPSTTISYDVSGDTHVNISIYNIMGQEIANLVDSYKVSGSYSVVWSGTSSNGVEMPSGVYFMKLNTDGQSITNKLSLLR